MGLAHTARNEAHGGGGNGDALIERLWRGRAWRQTIATARCGNAGRSHIRAGPGTGAAIARPESLADPRSRHPVRGLFAVGIVAVETVITLFAGSYIAWRIIFLALLFWTVAAAVAGAALAVAAMPALLIVKGAIPGGAPAVACRGGGVRGLRGQCRRQLQHRPRALERRALQSGVYRRRPRSRSRRQRRF